MCCTGLSPIAVTEIKINVVCTFDEIQFYNQRRLAINERLFIIVNLL